MPTNFPSGLRSRGVPVEGLGFPLLPNAVWYVDDASGNDNNSGKTSGQAFATIEKAISVSAARDVFVLAPGSYVVATANLPLTPKANQVFLAGIPSPIPNVTISDDGGGSDTDLVDIEVDNVRFEGIKFAAGHADVARLIKVSDTADILGLSFRNCWFDAVTFATVNGISTIDATFFCTGLEVVGCRDVGCDVGINVGVLGFPQAVVRDNVFEISDVGGTDVGIALADTGAGATGYGFLIEDNSFIGPTDGGADAVGISIAGTENTTAIGGIGRNFFYNCNVAAITIDKISKSEVNNYVGDAATGGTLVDPGT